jgi:hypothetical protein
VSSALMVLIPNRGDRLNRLAEQFRLAPALTPTLIISVIADACVRLPALYTRTAVRIDQLIKAGAWNDVALALIEFELPGWKLRRLVYQDGEWLCSLSKQPNMAEDIDETADAVHEVLPLAILSAFVEARRRMGTARGFGLPAVRSVQWPSDNAACCDNFA